MNAHELRYLQFALNAERGAFVSRIQHQIDDPEEYRAEILEKLTDSEVKLLDKIDLALERMDNDVYGICTRCNDEIPFSRLKAKPSVSLCLPCQKKHEHDD